MIEIVLCASKVFTTPIVILVDTPIYEKSESKLDPLIEYVT
jgi:hypothetical protein